LAYSDSLERENKKLMIFFVNTLNQNTSLSNQYNKLRRLTNMMIIESNDKRIRFFSWDTHTGGTMDQIAVIAQFADVNGMPHSKIINSASLFFKTAFFADGPNVILNSIYEIGDKTTGVKYLVTGQGKCETMCVSNQINVFSILNNELISPKVILTNRDTNSLTFNYRVFDLKTKWEPKYIVNKQKQIILEPIIATGKSITEKKYRTYFIKK
jgi:hypothetical protein